MTQNDLLDIIMPKFAEAKKKLELSPNAPYIFVKNEITYIDDEFEESNEYDGHGDVTLFASMTVYIRDRYSDDDPCFISFIDFDLKDITVKDPGTIDTKLSDFEEAVNSFSERLDAAEDAEAFIAEESKKQDEENEAEMKEFEESLDRSKKYSIAAIAVMGIIVLILIILDFLK